MVVLRLVPLGFLAYSSYQLPVVLKECPQPLERDGGLHLGQPPLLPHVALARPEPPARTSALNSSPFQACHHATTSEGQAVTSPPTPGSPCRLGTSLWPT
jgi:hypothetical protein